jgi:hypothetical protein
MDTLPNEILRMVATASSAETLFVLACLNRRIHSLLNEEFWKEAAARFGFEEDAPRLVLWRYASSGLLVIRNRVGSSPVHHTVKYRRTQRWFFVDVAEHAEDYYFLPISDRGGCFGVWQQRGCTLRHYGITDCRIHSDGKKVALAAVFCGRLICYSVYTDEGSYFVYDVEELGIEASRLVRLYKQGKEWHCIYLGRDSIAHKLIANKDSFSVSDAGLPTTSIRSFYTEADEIYWVTTEQKGWIKRTRYAAIVDDGVDCPLITYSSKLVADICSVPNSRLHMVLYRDGRLERVDEDGSHTRIDDNVISMTSHQDDVHLCYIKRS